MPILGVLEAEGVFFERSSRRAEVSTGGVASPESGGASRSMALRLASLRLGRVSPVAAAGRAGGWAGRDGLPFLCTERSALGCAADVLALRRHYEERRRALDLLPHRGHPYSFTPTPTPPPPPHPDDRTHPPPHYPPPIALVPPTEPPPPSSLRSPFDLPSRRRNH